MSKVNLIAAISKLNRTIGMKGGGLPWNIKEDLKYFKDKTNGHPIIMGRKTFEEFPSLLPNRTHIVVTRQSNYNPNKKVIVVSSIEKAIEKAAELDEEIFVIGGAQIYELALPFADRLYLTLVDTEIDGPAKFPEYENSFELKESKKESNANFNLEFTVWEPKRK